jgi:hypothetical protein
MGRIPKKSEGCFLVFLFLIAGFIMGCSLESKWDDEEDTTTDNAVDNLDDTVVPDTPSEDPLIDTTPPDTPPDSPDDPPVDTADTSDSTTPCTGVIYQENFESSNGGFTTDHFESSDPPSSWTWGSVTAGPTACHGGTGSCWSTNLHGSYAPCENSWVVSPEIDLSGCSGGTRIVLSFWHWYEFEGTSVCFDGATVELSNDGGSGWIQVTPEEGWASRISAMGTTCFNIYVDDMMGFNCMGNQRAWEQIHFVLPSSLFTSRMRFRIVAGSDSIEHFLGYTIDDVGLQVD